MEEKSMQEIMDKASVLIEALPYIQRFNRKIIVVKYGGSAMVDEELKKSVIQDVTLLKLVGFKPIIVHGGGKEISKWVGKVGMEPEFINGLRKTDAATMEIAEMVLSKVNKSLVQMVEALGVNAIGISGKDGGLLKVEKKYSNGQDIGFVGEITEVNPKILHDLLEKDFLPIVCPVGMDDEFNTYNINADDAACAIARAVNAEKLAFLTREDHFVITVASEIMAVLCLADDMEDLKRRLGNIIVAYNFEGKPVTADELHATGSMAALLKDALKPNLIQTLEHTPAIVHGGPFANIAHGCNSVRATKAALKLADIVVTEAGFGADLGAEKFLDIKCRKAGLKPDAVVLVATVRALKYNGGVPKENLSDENLEALKKGIVNLEKHIENLQKYHVPVVVTLNSFVSDTEAEVAYIENFCKERGCEFALSEVWEKGGEGGIALANKVLETLEKKESHFAPIYEDSLSLEEKIETIAKEIYGADGVTYSPAAKKELKRITDMGMGHFPVCMAKTQYSLSDDPKKLGRPSGFTVNVREVYVSAGAEFVVAVNGSIMTMPGLPKKPAAFGIDVDANGTITGLF